MCVFVCVFMYSDMLMFICVCYHIACVLRVIVQRPSRNSGECVCVCVRVCVCGE